MNKPNVLALAKLLGPIWETGKVGTGELDLLEMAKELSACGVLVPSALTKDEIIRAWYAASDTSVDEAAQMVDRSCSWPEEMAHELERIAKGEKP
jgi:hypothetical protein